MRKLIFGQIRIGKAKIRLRMSAVGSKPSLPAKNIVGYYRIFRWRSNAHVQDDVNPHICACSNVLFRLKNPSIGMNPDKTAQDELSHQDLRCLPLCLDFD